MSETDTFSVGIVSFDFPPVYRKRESVSSDHSRTLAEVVRALDAGVEVTVTDPLAEIQSRRVGASGVATPGDLDVAVRSLRSAGIECLLVELTNWTRVSLVTGLIDAIGVPTALVAVTTGGRSGITAATAVSGSLREFRRGSVADLVERFIDSDTEELRVWLRGVQALARMRKSRVISFGGSYGADIPFTRTDAGALESRFVKEILSEQEMVIIERARTLLSSDRNRVSGFIEWLETGGVRIKRDGRMLTDESLAFQTAMYLATRDRLGELSQERIAGISVKCHFEVSTTCIGCTMCMIPAFLPFARDSEGAREVVPVACEGDIMGLLGLVLLHSASPAAPPLFGDIVAYRDTHLLLRNCGSSSAYWAKRSLVESVALPALELLPNIHGKSGAAVHYETPPGGPVTLARLFRLSGEYYLFYGVADILAQTADTTCEDPWPHTRLKLASSSSLLYKTAPTNHASLAEGDLTRELAIFCRYTGVRGVRCDSDGPLEEFLEVIRTV